jgi:hypothetical protein
MSDCRICGKCTYPLEFHHSSMPKIADALFFAFHRNR